MRRSNIIAWTILTIAILLVAAFTVTVLWIHPDDWASALGGVLGSVVGFLGAAISVYILFDLQIKDETARISGAIIREVAEFSRVAVGNLHLCEDIQNKRVSIPRAHLPEIMKASDPVVYPAVADRIGRLRSPQHVVAFHNRIAQASVVVRLIALKYPTWPDMHPDELVTLANIWITVCQLAAQIIDKESSALARDPEIAFFREHIAAGLKSAQTIFPNVPAFAPMEPNP